MRTGEIYFEKDTLVTDEEIKSFNNSLDSWERRQGKSLVQKDGYVYIDFYEQTTLHILQYLMKLSKCANREQRIINQRFLKENEDLIKDAVKEQALKNAFVKSKVLLIYGAAGTGKTTHYELYFQYADRWTKIISGKNIYCTGESEKKD